jgi:hypothetical protein
VARARASRARVFPIQSVVNISGLELGLKKLEKDIREKVMRSGAYAGINVFYEGLRVAVPVNEGTLFASIYKWHDEKSSNPNRQVYKTGPNKSKAAHWYFIEYGHYLYNRRGADGKWLKAKSSPRLRVAVPGTRDASVHDLPGARENPEWVPQRAFVRPTWDNLKSYSIKAMQVRMAERFKELA